MRTESNLKTFSEKQNFERKKRWQIGNRDRYKTKKKNEFNNNLDEHEHEHERRTKKQRSSCVLCDFEQRRKKKIKFSAANQTIRNGR